MKSLVAILLIFSLYWSACQVEQHKESINEISFVNLFSTDMKSGVACYRIPSIITALNGDIITAIDERVPSCGDLKINDDINIVMRRSTNNGTTWSDMETIVDYPKSQSASDPSMILDRTTGELFLFFNYMNLETEKGIYYFKVISSKDNGITWSEPVDITSQISKSEWKNDFKFITSGRGIQTKNGDLIHTLVNLEHGLHLFKSTDHGVSWQLIDSPIIPGDESKVAELENGSLMVNSRVSKIGTRYVHTSTDQGLTWSSKLESQLVDPACNAGFIQYAPLGTSTNKSGLLFSNANSKESRENLTVKISYDQGLTWSKGKTIYPKKAAYSSMTVLQNGDIGLLFEKDDYKENVFTHFSLEWLTDGEDASKTK